MTGCTLDTDVVIAALDRRDAHHAAAATCLRRLARAKAPRLLSSINYAEALVRPAEHDDTLKVAVEAIEVLGIAVKAPTPEIARDAARLRGLGISLAAGFALATARANDVAIATFDRRVRRAAEASDIPLASGLEDA